MKTSHKGVAFDKKIANLSLSITLNAMQVNKSIIVLRQLSRPDELARGIHLTLNKHHELFMSKLVIGIKPYLPRSVFDCL